MGYVLTRALFILIAWAMSCLLVRNLWPGVEPTVFGALGPPWVFGGIAYFAYLRRLRRDIEELEFQRYGLNPRRNFRAARSPITQ